MQIWCLLKPGGVLFLALPMTRQDNGHIVYNAHRVYGWKRLSHMTANFRTLGPNPLPDDPMLGTYQDQHIFIMERLPA
jgi:hypothetical protein